MTAHLHGSQLMPSLNWLLSKFGWQKDKETRVHFFLLALWKSIRLPQNLFTDMDIFPTECQGLFLRKFETCRITLIGEQLLNADCCRDEKDIKYSRVLEVEPPSRLIFPTLDPSCSYINFSNEYSNLHRRMPAEENVTLWLRVVLALEVFPDSNFMFRSAQVSITVFAARGRTRQSLS